MYKNESKDIVRDARDKEFKHPENITSQGIILNGTPTQHSFGCKEKKKVLLYISLFWLNTFTLYLVIDD